MSKAVFRWPNFVRKIRERATTDVEFNQSIVRLVMGFVSFFYILTLSDFDPTNLYRYSEVFWLTSVLYFFGSVAISTIVYAFPKQVSKRRYLYIIPDLAGPIALMSDGGAATLPVFAGVALATLGHGVRYGKIFLLVAMFGAAIGLFVVMSTNQFLIQNPFVGYMLFATLVTTSIYPVLLLEQLGKAMRIAQDDDQQKSAFLANASHDLRQPIHVIAMLAAQLAETRLAPGQRELVSRIEDSSEAVIKLFQSLLDISIIESGELEPKIQPVSLSQLFSELPREHYTAAERAGVSLRVVGSEHSVLTDQTLLRTIIRNIVSNAIKYSEDGRILVGCRVSSGQASIWICDQGRGIEAEDMEHIFDLLYRAPGEGGSDIPGAGLGLAIVKRLSDLLDITVEIRSEPNKGTTVILGNLPLTDERPFVSKANIDERPRLLHGLSVTLIDDSEALLQSTGSLLEQWGCEVRALTEFPPELDDCDVVLTDFDFGDGNTLVSHIDCLRSEQAKGTAVIIMSGHPEDVVRRKLGSWVGLVLPKPVAPAGLRSLLMSKKVEMDRD